MLAALGREAQGRASLNCKSANMPCKCWLSWHLLAYMFSGCLAWTQAIQCPKEIVWLNGAPGSVRLATPPCPA